MAEVYVMLHSSCNVHMHYSTVHSRGMKPFELIKLLADDTRLSTLELARRMHKPSFQGTLHRLISGESKAPTHNTAKIVADYFAIPVEALYDDSVAQRVAIERGFRNQRAKVDDPPQASEPTTPPTPISSRRRSFPVDMLSRIERLNKQQFQALETMVAAYLDTIAPDAAGSKRQDMQ